MGLRGDDHKRNQQSANATAAGERSQGSATAKTTLPRDPELGRDEELLGQQLDLAPRLKGVLMAGEHALWAEIQQCISRCRENKMNSPGDEQNAVLQLLADQMESITDMDWVDEVMDEMWLYVALPGSWGVSTEESVEKMWKIFHRRMREWEDRRRNPEGGEELLYRGDAPDVRGKQTEGCRPDTGWGNPDGGTTQRGVPAHVAIPISTTGPGAAKEADAVATAGTVTYDPDDHTVATAATTIHSPAAAPAAAAATGVADIAAAVTTGTANAKTAAAIEGDTRTADTSVVTATVTTAAAARIADTTAATAAAKGDTETAATAVSIDPAGTDTRTTTAGVAAVATAKTADPATATQTKYCPPPQERMGTQTKCCPPPQEQDEKQTKFRLQRQTQTTPLGADKEYQPKAGPRGETRNTGNARGRIPAPDAVRAGTVNAAPAGDADNTTAVPTPAAAEGDTKTVDAAVFAAAAEGDTRTADTATVTTVAAEVINATATATTAAAEGDTETSDTAVSATAAAGATNATATTTTGTAEVDTRTAATFAAATSRVTNTAATTTTATAVAVIDSYTTAPTATITVCTHTNDATAAAVTYDLTTNMTAAAGTVTHHCSTTTTPATTGVTATATDATATAADAAAVTAAAGGDRESPSLAGTSTSKIPLAKTFADPKEEPPDTAAGNGEIPSVVSTPTGGMPPCRVSADLEGEPPDAAAGDGEFHRLDSAPTGGPPPASATAAEEKGLCCNVAAGDGEEPSQATRGRRDPEPPDPGAYIPPEFRRKPALPAKGGQGKMALMVFGLLLCGCPRLQPGARKEIRETRENPAKGLEAQGDPVGDLEDGEGLDRGWKPERVRPEDREIQEARLEARRMTEVRTRAWKPGEIQPGSWEEKAGTEAGGRRRTTKKPGGQGEDLTGAKRPGKIQPEERRNPPRAWRPGGDQPRDWRPDKAQPEPRSREGQSRESVIDENESRLSLIISSLGCLI